MKKIIVSLATASLIASSAMAADKGIDFTTSGQAVFYYQTLDKNGNDTDLFGKDTAKANVGVQLDFNADLKNDFTFGAQLTYLGDLGMDKNIANGQMLSVGGDANSDFADEIALTKFWVAKKIANTTVKIGRQELPKSLSPFVFTEGWTVFKNTFDAALVVNKDIPNTIVAAAYVDKSNSTAPGSDFTDFSDPKVGNKAVYMLSAQNKSIPMTKVTATYYSSADRDTASTGGVAADIIWGSAVVADKSLPMGLNVAVQGGVLSVDGTGTEDTNGFGAKLGIKPMKALALSVAYSSIDDGSISAQNLGTGVKTPLYTQMVLNQGEIAWDADTYVAKAVYNTGAYGKIIAAYGMTDDKATSDRDYNEFDLIYKVKSGNVNYLAMWVNQDWDSKASGTDNANLLRFVARYKF